MASPTAGRSQVLDVTPQQVDMWVETNKFKTPRVAAALRDRLANRASCQWLGDWTTQPRLRAREIAQHARANGALFQVVVYNIPNRDAGGFSAGGAQSRAAYLAWLREVATGLNCAGAPAVGGTAVTGLVIVEPDALAHAAAFEEAPRRARLALLADAVDVLRRRCPSARLYLDVGHPGWLGVDRAAALAAEAGACACAGVSVNVSNTYPTELCFRYGSAVASRAGASAAGAPLGVVIDTSRNGAGPPPPDVLGVERWANVPTARLGAEPCLRPVGGAGAGSLYDERLHALLWVKVPGESDGKFRGAPDAGIFWLEGALRLIGYYDDDSCPDDGQAADGAQVGVEREVPNEFEVTHVAEEQNHRECSDDGLGRTQERTPQSP